MKEKVDSYLALADDICKAAKTFIDESMSVLRRQSYVLKTRDKVLLGLGLKIDSAFRALIDDARHRRVEAVHHLKTILEAFIYMFAVAKDDSDRTAEQLLAEISEQKAKYYRLNPDRDTPLKRNREYWEEGLRRFANVGISPIGGVANAASHHSPGLGKWYDAAYRLACETAHIADLFDFIPDEDMATVEAGKLDTGPYRAQTALDYGIQALLSTIQLANANELGLALDIAPFERRLEEIRAEAHS